MTLNGANNRLFEFLVFNKLGDVKRPDYPRPPYISLNFTFSSF